MAFYESVFIIRQDVSSSDVDKIIDSFINIINENGGKVVKNEYWGLRTLAYEIGNNKKGHYVLFGIDCQVSTITEMERKMKLSENIIRFSTIKVDQISLEPSAVLRGKSMENEEVIDVTVNKDSI